MNKLKCWFAGSRDPFEFPHRDVVFANSHQEAKAVVWKKGWHIRDECDSNFFDLRITRQKHYDHLSQEDEPHVINDNRILRLMGWMIEGDLMCDSCGLHPMGIDEFDVCPECNQCSECGHDDECFESQEKGN